MAFLCTLISSEVSQANISTTTKATPVEFSAVNLIYDEEHQTVMATGDVEVTNGLKIVRADEVTYNLADESVKASGNVTLLDEDGNVVFAQELELKNEMRDGYIKKLLAILADGSRITSSFSKSEKSGNLLTMKKAAYTSCKVCEEDPNPTWQIKASKVEYDKEEQTISYKNARLEFMGVPLIYTPYFAHPDPTLKSKSGFLRPGYGWSDSLGANADISYYYNIDPSKDLTFKVMPTTLAGTLIGSEYRQKFDNGEMSVEVSTVKSDRKEEDGTTSEDRQRGHIDAEGKFDLTDNWRGGFNYTRSSDKQYLRLYNITDADVITNEAYTEYFNNRDYAKISVMNFQDTRIDVDEDQPNILPMASYSIMGEPEGLLGGRWAADMSLMVLDRSTDEQDMQRLSMSSEWQRKDTLSSGIKNTLRFSDSADLYTVQNSNVSAMSDDYSQTRLNVIASNVISYPLIKPVFDNKAKTIIEPMLGIALSPNRDTDEDDEIPNEDSIDLRFDSLNLFDDNRYTGLDKREDGGRATVGVKTSLYDNDGNFGKLFIGQSYKLYGNNEYAKGSGLENDSSDYVGQLKLGFDNYLDADYRFQFDNKTLAAKRHEVQASGGSEDLRLGVRYIYIDAVEGTGFDEPREQIYLENLYRITKKWSFNSSALLDVSDDDPGFRKASAGFTYTDDCFAFSFKGERNITDEASGEDKTSFIMRVGLNNIGAFSENDFLLGDNSQ